jgi:hypothetical protein
MEGRNLAIGYRYGEFIPERLAELAADLVRCRVSVIVALGSALATRAPLPRERSYPIDVTAAPTKVHPHVAANGPTQVRKRLSERRDDILVRRIVFAATHEHADAPDAVALLRPRPQRPSCRAPQPCYELPPSHRSFSEPLYGP